MIEENGEGRATMRYTAEMVKPGMTLKNVKTDKDYVVEDVIAGKENVKVVFLNALNDDEKRMVAIDDTDDEWAITEDTEIPKYKIGDTVAVTYPNDAEPFTAVITNKPVDPCDDGRRYYTVDDCEGNVYCVPEYCITTAAMADRHAPVKDKNHTQAKRVWCDWCDKHYDGDIQPIELMQAQFNTDALVGFLRGNIIKYAARLGKKGVPSEDARKILRYAEWLADVCDGKTVNPRE